MIDGSVVDLRREELEIGDLFVRVKLVYGEREKGGRRSSKEDKSDGLW